MPENQKDADSASVRQLPRPVWILSWVSFFADVSSEMVYPLLPLFMIGVLGSSKTQLGLMEGGAVFVVAIMSAVPAFEAIAKEAKAAESNGFDGDMDYPFSARRSSHWRLSGLWSLVVDSLIDLVRD